MKPLIFVLPWLVLTIVPPASTAESEIGNDVYELTAELAVSILPEPLRSFYRRHLGELKSKARAPEDWIAAPDTPSARPSIGLDAGATVGDRRARLESARKFPRSEPRPRGSGEATSGGGVTLPGSIHERFLSLQEYFRSGVGTGSPADATALLIVLSTDAAMPFSTTSGALFGATDAARFLHDHQARFHGELVRRLRKRLELEAKIDPSRLKSTSQVVGAVIDTAIEAYQWIDPLLDIEATVAEEIVARSGEAMEKHEERFLDELADRAYPVLEARIEAGALLAANLIVGAWIEAGKPVVATDAPVITTDQPKVETNRATAFMGSKDSTVYHKTDCVHLARVKPENRVTFEDAKSAAAKGRKPCKTCKPDAASLAPTSP